tara:strand:- start:2164 stop:3030 length:867 start_codon:yes stop_codon:yes gene_type:complete
MTRRNNEERSGVKDFAPDLPIPPIVQDKPEQEHAFSFTLPTQFVELPSRGRYYPEGHPLHGRESIEIRYMIAKDEDILSSKTLLKKGVAIDRFLQNIIMDKSIRLDDMLVGDKNALMIAARITGYGESYETKVTCPSCAGVSEYDFNLLLCPINHAEDYDSYGLKVDPEGYFLLKLPISGVEVKFRLLRGNDEKKISSMVTRKKKNKLPESIVTDLFKSLIVSVNGDERPGLISNFINVMPARDSRFLREAYEASMPTIDMSHEFLCEHCGSETILEVPLNAEFFWPK